MLKLVAFLLACTEALPFLKEEFCHMLSSQPGSCSPGASLGYGHITFHLVIFNWRWWGLTQSPSECQIHPKDCLSYWFFDRRKLEASIATQIIKVAKSGLGGKGERRA